MIAVQMGEHDAVATVHRLLVRRDVGVVLVAVVHQRAVDSLLCREVTRQIVPMPDVEEGIVAPRDACIPAQHVEAHELTLLAKDRRCASCSDQARRDNVRTGQATQFVHGIDNLAPKPIQYGLPEKGALCERKRQRSHPQTWGVTRRPTPYVAPGAR